MNIVWRAFEAGKPKVEQIVEQLAGAIARGDLPPGSRLHTVRQLTETLGVSKFTVIDALDRLRARHLIVSRQGAGYFVTRAASHTDTAPALDFMPQDIVSVLRRSLITETGALRAGCGLLPESWMDTESLRHSLRSSVRSNLLRLADYGAAPGYLPLRQALRERLRAIGIDLTVDQIVTTSSTMYSVDMLLRLLVRPGDGVLLDDPCYFNFHANLALHGGRAITVARTPNGIDLAAIETVFRTEKPRVYVTSSILQNPTGQSIAPTQAFKLLQLAQAHQVHIIEDDIYGDLHPNPPPRLAALAGLDNVTYVSGFSKTVTANARVSYIAAAPRLTAALTNLKLMIGGGTSEMLEQFIGKMLSEGGYTRQLGRIKPQLAESAFRVSTWLKEAGCSMPYPYEGGFFLWIALPDGADAEILAMQTLKHGVVLAPGTLLSRAPDARHYLRFNVAHSDEPRVKEQFMRQLDLYMNRATV